MFGFLRRKSKGGEDADKSKGRKASSKASGETTNSKVSEPQVRTGHEIMITMVTPVGETFSVEGSEQMTVAQLKRSLAKVSSIHEATMLLFILDDTRDLEDVCLLDGQLLLELMVFTESTMVLALAVVLRDMPLEWDAEWKGDTITISEYNTLATQTASSSFVRSKEAFAPGSGSHCAEFVYTDKAGKTDGEGMSIYLIVGVVQGCVEKRHYNTDWGVGRAQEWWGLVSCGTIHRSKNDDAGTSIEGMLIEGMLSCPDTSRNKHSVPFGAGDRIGFTIDMDYGLMQFYRNGEPMKGVAIEGMPVDQPLYIVGCPRTSGTTLKLARPSAPYGDGPRAAPEIMQVGRGGGGGANKPPQRNWQ
jgi:hypothetical protein